jgi:UDP-N-acetylglucosamine 3-dehydrogenase
MFFFYNNDEPAEWVIGQLNWEEEQTAFAVQLETDGLSYVKWKNNVYGLLVTGRATGGGCNNRLIGTKGMIEVYVDNGPAIRVMQEGTAGWQIPSLDDVPKGDDTVLSVLDLLSCLKTGREPELSGRKALQATELIFSTYESSRKRARIYLPLEIKDSPLLSMLNRGMIGPKRTK